MTSSLLAISLLMFLSHFNCEVISVRPTDPVWPDKFEQKFSESFYYPLVGTHNTTGTYYYDWIGRRYRIDRANGRYDRYCGFNGVRAFQNTPCTQLVLEGVRWVIYPEKKSCCQCCHAANGCGILKPTWMSGAEYLGEKSGEYKWNKPGLQANYYYETVKGRVLTQIDQVPNDVQYYDPDSFKLTIAQEEEVFRLPDYCVKGDKCSLFSTCRAVG